MSVAILILSARRKEVELFQSLIDGLAEIDYALGREIGLFLFYPQSEGALQAWDRDTLFIGGERFAYDGENPTAVGAHDFFHTVNPDENPHYRDQIRRTVAHSSASIVSEFCAAFDIKPSDLPCVCTLIKGVHQPIISNAGERLSFARLVKAATTIRGELETVRTRGQHLIEGVDGLGRSLREVEQRLGTVDRKKQRILSLVSGLEMKYGVTLAPQITAMLALDSLSAQSFEAVVREVSGEQSDRILRDSRSQGIRHAISAWQERRSEVARFVEANPLNGLQDRVMEIDAIRSELEGAIRAAYADAGISVFRFSEYAGSVAKLSRALSTLAKVVALVKSVGTH